MTWPLSIASSIQGVKLDRNPGLDQNSHALGQPRVNECSSVEAGMNGFSSDGPCQEEICWTHLSCWKLELIAYMRATDWQGRSCTVDGARPTLDSLPGESVNVCDPTRSLVNHAYALWYLDFAENSLYPSISLILCSQGALHRLLLQERTSTEYSSPIHACSRLPKASVIVSVLGNMGGASG